MAGRRPREKDLGKIVVVEDHIPLIENLMRFTPLGCSEISNKQPIKSPLRQSVKSVSLTSS